MIRSRLAGWLAKVRRYPGRCLAVLLLGVGLCIAAPQAWAWYHFQRARSFLERYHPEEARRELDACQKVWPNRVAVHLLAARAARQVGASEEAERHLWEARHLQPDEPTEVTFEWALHRAALGDPSTVEAYLRPRLQGTAEETALVGEDARYWLALCLLDGGQYAEALPLWERLRELRPGDAAVRVHLARCRHHLGQSEEAQRLLEAVLAEEPDLVLALRTLGQVLLESGQAGDAEPWLRRAVSLAPGDYQANWLLAQVLRQRNSAEAEEQQARAIQLEQRWKRLRQITSRELIDRPHDAALERELGTLFLELGYRDIGQHWLLAAAHERPDHP